MPSTSFYTWIIIITNRLIFIFEFPAYNAYGTLNNCVVWLKEMYKVNTGKNRFFIKNITMRCKAEMNDVN